MHVVQPSRPAELAVGEQYESKQRKTLEQRLCVVKCLRDTRLPDDSVSPRRRIPEDCSLRAPLARAIDKAMAATLKGRFPVSKPTEVVKGDAKGKAPRTGRGVAVQQGDAEAKFELDKHELMLFDFDSVRARPRRRC